MGYLDDINASYAEHERMANFYAGVDPNQQHAAHLVMQQLVAQRDAYIRSLQASSAPVASNGAPVTHAAASPSPAPVLPVFKPITAPAKNIKSAPSDIIQFDDDSIEIALIQDLLFEDIGATELANISRSDLIDGQSTIYSPIKNLSTVRREFNPNNLVSTAYGMKYFSRFGIDIDSRGIHEPYFDEDGNLIIEIDSVGDGEEVQIQILSSGTINLVDES